MCAGMQGNPGIFGIGNLNLRSEGMSVKCSFLRMDLCSLRNSAGFKNLSPALTKLPSPQPAFPSTAVSLEFRLQERPARRGLLGHVLG